MGPRNRDPEIEIGPFRRITGRRVAIEETG